MTTLTIDFRKLKLPQIKQILHVLGGKTRVEILKRIHETKDLSASNLAKSMELSVSSVCQHIDLLEKAGLVVKKTAKTLGNNIKVIEPVYDRIDVIFPS